VCLHTHGEVRRFGTLRCVIHSWLIWCKNYRNRSDICKSCCKKFTDTLFITQCTRFTVIYLFPFFRSVLQITKGVSNKSSLSFRRHPVGLCTEALLISQSASYIGEGLQYSHFFTQSNNNKWYDEQQSSPRPHCRVLPPGACAIANRSMDWSMFHWLKRGLVHGPVSYWTMDKLMVWSDSHCSSESDDICERFPMTLLTNTDKNKQTH